MSVWTARWVVVSQPINQSNLRVPAKNRLQINRFTVAVFHHRNDLKILQNRLNFSWIFGLQRTHHDILSAQAPATPLVQHLKRFADTCRVAEEDLQPAAPRAPLL